MWGIKIPGPEGCATSNLGGCWYLNGCANFHPAIRLQQFFFIPYVPTLATVSLLNLCPSMFQFSVSVSFPQLSSESSMCSELSVVCELPVLYPSHFTIGLPVKVLEPGPWMRIPNLLVVWNCSNLIFIICSFTESSK